MTSKHLALTLSLMDLIWY